MGLIYATLGEHEAAVERFADATQLDQYLAVACVFYLAVYHSASSCRILQLVTSKAASLIFS
jgi:hypothetical protein